MAATLALISVVLFLLALWRRGGRGRVARRAGELEAGLDFTIDLMAVVLGSGGTVRHGVEVVADCGPPVVGQVFGAIIERADAGALLADALSGASRELGPAYHPFIGALTAAERDGAPIALILQHLAEEAEQARRWRAEARAKRTPVAMLAPMVFCLLPAVVVGAVVPLAIVSFRQISG